MNDLFDEKVKVVLGLIRTNNTADDVMKITQAVGNLVHAQAAYQQLTKAPAEQAQESKGPPKKNVA